MNKQPGSTHSTSLNGSRSCYITTKRFVFLSAGTKLVSTIDISNNILNWFWTLFKNVNTLTKRQEKGICLMFKKNIAHLAPRPTLRSLIIASAKRLKSLFVQAKFTQTFCIWPIHVSNENNSAIIIPTIRVNVLQIVIALKKLILVSNKKSILREMFDFAVTQVDNFCQNVFTVFFKLFDGKYTSLVLFKPER